MNGYGVRERVVGHLARLLALPSAPAFLQAFRAKAVEEVGSHGND